MDKTNSLLCFKICVSSGVRGFAGVPLRLQDAVAVEAERRAAAVFAEVGDFGESVPELVFAARGGFRRGAGRAVGRGFEGGEGEELAGEEVQFLKGEKRGGRQTG